MAVGLSFEIDIQIASFAFIITGLLYRATHDWFEKNLPKWHQFPQSVRDRMCVEIACIPVRIGLIYFTLPAVVTVFTPAESWTAEYTRDALIASSIMTGAYLFDLIIYRQDVLSVLHHCMGPALLLWIRTCFSSFTSADALVCRSLMMFVFFGAATGGVAASSGVFLLRVGKKYLSREVLYKYFALSVASLTVTTVLSCYMNVYYFVHVWDQAFAYFGVWAVFPILWETFECYLQWRWLFRFYVFEAKFCQLPSEREARSPSPDILKDVPTPEMPCTTYFPRWTVPVLKVLTAAWTILLGVLYFNLAQELYFLCASQPESAFVEQLQL